MKVIIRAKFVGCLEKTSQKGNKYYQVSLLQDNDIEKYYFPTDSIKYIEPLSDVVANVNITKNHFGYQFTILDIEGVD